MSGKKHGLQDKYKKLKMGGMMYYSKGALSEKQKVIASKAPPFDKIDGKDFAKMKVRMNVRSGSLEKDFMVCQEIKRLS